LPKVLPPLFTANADIDLHHSLMAMTNNITLRITKRITKREKKRID
jgi:hypothetical protein